MQNKSTIESQLVQAEAQLEHAMLCLNLGDATALTQASEALQNTAVGLVQMMHSARSARLSPEVSRKIGQLAQQLIALRENLLRRLAFVDRALKVVLPNVSDSTYQPTGPYGAGPRSSGTMSVISA